MTLRISILVLILLAASAPALLSQEPPSGKLSGLVFGDYFYKIQGDSTGAGSQYSSVKKDQQAFQFRRFYLFYDYTLSETFAAQFLLEGNDRALTDGKHGIFLKTAYVEWKNILPLASLSFGLIPTPSWVAVTEKAWAYRAIEKTIADFHGLGVATDIGVGLRGKFSESSTLSYSVMIGNGGGQKPEVNKYKKYYGSLLYKPAADLLVEGYADFEPSADDRSITTLKGFAAYQTDGFTIGCEAVTQTQKKSGAAGADRSPLGVAAFARAPFPGSENLGWFARFDYYDPDTKITSGGFTERFITAGLDFTPAKNLHLMPNIWVNTFSDKSGQGLSQDADIVGRVTFFLVFK
jgi:hypothetical protein